MTTAPPPATPLPARGAAASASSAAAPAPASIPAATAAAPAGLLDHALHPRWTVPVLLLLAALPPLAAAAGEDFYIGLATRILVFALAATSLNLILGFGGMVSFGHAAFVGTGAYAVGILMQQGVASAWIAWPAAVLASALFALAVGAVSLRTRGVYFIMITLAFAQMLFYLMVSVKAWGGEDGLALPGRSAVGGGFDLASDTRFYYVVLALFVLAFLGIQRLLNARFGHALQAIRENETRMGAIGFPVYRYQLAAFTLAGGLAGLAGALLANQSGFVSPSLLQWNQSGLLLVMVILGGVGHPWGGFIGAVAFLLLEEVLSAYTIHWQFILGAVLLLVVLAAPRGLAGLLRREKKA
jgi:branched-chain amino acid transport system permease protein